MRSNKRRLILEGPLYRVILTLAVPLMINNFIQTVYNLVDSMWLGRLGATEFASTSFVWPVVYLFITVGLGISVAGTSIMSQLIGRDNAKEAKSYATHMLVMGMIASLGIAVTGYLLTPFIVTTMGAVGDLNRYSTTYLQIIFLGFPAVIMTFVYNGIMNAQGNTKAITVISGIGAVMNMVLDPIFIFETVPFLGIQGLGLGVAGAALATIVSQYIQLILGTYIVTQYSKDIEIVLFGEKLSKEKFKHVVKIGFPSVVGQSSEAFGFIVLNVFIASYGTETLAAFALVNRMTSLIMQPANGIGSAITTIVGQNMGAGNIDRVKECYRKSNIISLSMNITGAVFMYLFSTRLISIFINPNDIGALLPIAIEYIIFSLFIMPNMGVFNILLNFFQGTGHTEYSMQMTSGRLWLLRLPSIFLLGQFTNIGSMGIWISMLMSNVVVNLYGYYQYRRGKWQKRVV